MPKGRGAQVAAGIPTTAGLRAGPSARGARDAGAGELRAAPGPGPGPRTPPDAGWEGPGA